MASMRCFGIGLLISKDQKIYSALVWFRGEMSTVQDERLNSHPRMMIIRSELSMLDSRLEVSSASEPRRCTKTFEAESLS